MESSSRSSMKLLSSDAVFLVTRSIRAMLRDSRASYGIGDMGGSGGCGGGRRDVDLRHFVGEQRAVRDQELLDLFRFGDEDVLAERDRAGSGVGEGHPLPAEPLHRRGVEAPQIGRASCRERGWI